MADIVEGREVTVEVTNNTSQDIYEPKPSTRGQIMFSTFQEGKTTHNTF